MGSRVTVILIVLNITLFSLLFFLDRRESANAAFRDNTRQVFGGEAVDIDYLKISLAGEERDRVFQRSGEKWNIREPIDWPANPFAIHRLLQQIRTLERETSFRVADLNRAGQDLAGYGLDDPRITLTFGRGEHRYEVKVGDTTDLGNRLYILDPAGETIHVVARGFAETLSLSLSDLRSETVFHIPLHEARSLNLQTSGQTKVRLTRRDDQWSFETPFHTGADNRAVDASINRLNSLRIHSFMPPSTDPGSHGLNNPAMRITLDGNARRETLLVGEPAPSEGNSDSLVYAKLADNPTIFTVPSAPLHLLDNAQVLLRDRKLTEIDRSGLTSINLSTPGRPDVLLQKLETQQWQVVSRFPDQSVRILPADTTLVDRLIDAIDRANITRFENDAPSDSDLANYGFDEPQRSIALNGGSPQTILVGDSAGSDGNEVYVKLADSRFVYTVDVSFLREIPVSTQYFRDRLLIRQPESAIVSGIRITDIRSGNAIYEVALPSSNASWEDAVKEKPEAERRALLALLPEIRNLRAQRYVHDGFAPTVLLDGRQVEFRYQLTADLLLPGGESPQKAQLQIHLSDRLGGTTLLAGSPDLNVVFTTRQDLLNAIAPLLFDRSPAATIESAAADENPDT